MQFFRPIVQEEAALVGWGVRVLLLAAPGSDPGRIAQRVAGLGGVIAAENDEFTAVEALAEDHTGFGLFMMDCDGFGGLEAGHRVLAMARRAARPVPAMLISRDVAVQTFPEDATAPILLRAPLSAVGLRVGFEHALRDRLVYRAA